MEWEGAVSQPHNKGHSSYELRQIAGTSSNIIQPNTIILYNSELLLLCQGGPDTTRIMCEAVAFGRWKFFNYFLLNSNEVTLRCPHIPLPHLTLLLLLLRPASPALLPPCLSLASLCLISGSLAPGEVTD